MRPGVVLRSTKQGTGGQRLDKYEYEGCQGGCAQFPVCNTSQLRSYAIPGASFLHWAGCGFSNNGFGTPLNASDARCV